MAQEGAFRRLLHDHELALQYDYRLNASSRLWMQVKFSLSSGDNLIETKD